MPLLTDCKTPAAPQTPTSASGLWLADAPLVARDAAIPGLEAALRTDRMREWLNAAAPDVSVNELQPYYVRYKPGTNCLVAYRVRCVNETWVHFHARAFSPAASFQLSRAELNAAVPGPLGVGLWQDCPSHLIVSAFPNDRELTALRRLGNPDEWKRIMQRLLPRNPELHEGTFEIRRYKPERRAVLLWRGADGGRAALKFYSATDYGRAKANASMMKRQRAVSVAPMLGRNGRRHILAFDWIDSQPLCESLDLKGFDASIAAGIGAALWELHHTKSLLPEHDAETPTLHEAAEGVAAVLPELEPRAKRLVQTLTPRVAPADQRSFIHGDFSAEQIILNGDSIAILDFDRGGLGDPRTDLGRFAAKLVLGHGACEPSIDATETFLDAMLDGYFTGHEAAEFSRTAWKAFAAAELLRLAVEPFRTRQPDWPDGVERLLSLAEHWSSDAR